MEAVGPIEPGEIKAVKFDFAPEAGASAVLSEPTVTCRVLRGEDPDPANVLVGGPAVDGQAIIQKVRPGVPGCEYLLQAWASDAAGLRHRIAASMLVSAV